MINLMRGDCIEKMKEIQSESIDLTITSPPYDNLRSYNGNNKHWDEHVWRKVFPELYRVTKHGGVVVWVVGDATIKGSETGTSLKQALYAMECGFNLHDTMIWEKTGSGALGSNNCYAQNFEFMFVLSKGRPKTINLICDRANMIKKGKVRVNSSLTAEKHSKVRIIERKEFGKRTNIWTINPKKKDEHPAPFPKNLALDHIKSWSDINDVVLDPFMGSGTSGLAAIDLNRNFVGIELDESYFNMAKNRIEQAINDQK